MSAPEFLTTVDFGSPQLLMANVADGCIILSLVIPIVLITSWVITSLWAKHRRDEDGSVHGFPPPSMQGYVLFWTFAVGMFYPDRFLLLGFFFTIQGATAIVASIDAVCVRREVAIVRIARFAVAAAALIGTTVFAVVDLESLVPNVRDFVIQGQQSLDSDLFQIFRDSFHGQTGNFFRSVAFVLSAFCTGWGSVSYIVLAPIRLLKIVALWTILLGGTPEPATGNLIIIIAKEGGMYSKFILVVLTFELIVATAHSVHTRARKNKTSASDSASTTGAESEQENIDVEVGSRENLDRPDPVNLVDVTSVYNRLKQEQTLGPLAYHTQPSAPSVDWPLDANSTSSTQTDAYHQQLFYDFSPNAHDLVPSAPSDIFEPAMRWSAISTGDGAVPAAATWTNQR